MKQLRIAGLVFKAFEGGVEIGKANWGFGQRVIFLPDSNHLLTSQQARKISC